MQILFGNKGLVQYFKQSPNGKLQVTYLMSTDDLQQSNFRYLFLKVDAVGTNCLQFSHMEFLTKFDQVFNYQKNCPNIQTQRIEGISRIISTEPFSNIFTAYNYDKGVEGNRSQNKFCTDGGYGSGWKLPFVYKIDLGSDCLDVKKYCKWRWRYSNDSWWEYGRNMTTFALYASNSPDYYDKENIWLLDKQVNQQYVKPIDTRPGISSQNYGDGMIAYTGNIILRKEETNG